MHVFCRLSYFQCSKIVLFELLEFAHEYNSNLVVFPLSLIHTLPNFKLKYNHNQVLLFTQSQHKRKDFPVQIKDITHLRKHAPFQRRIAILPSIDRITTNIIIPFRVAFLLQILFSCGVRLSFPRIQYLCLIRQTRQLIIFLMANVPFSNE